MEVIAVLYMQDWHICVPADFSLGFEGDNNAVTLEISTDLPEDWDLKVDVAKDGEKNIIQLNRRDNVYYALLTSSMLADDGVYEMQVRGTLGDQVRHSNIFLSHVHNSINATDAFPPPLPSEFEQMEDRLTSINNNPPQPGENGYWLIWDPDDMEYKESDIPLPAEGGTVGTTDYNKLKNRPSINGVELIGNKTSDELKIPAGEKGEKGDPGPEGPDRKAQRGQLAYKGRREIPANKAQPASRDLRESVDRKGRRVRKVTRANRESKDLKETRENPVRRDPPE